MTLKLFRAVWFLSALLVLVNLLYVYASLPETVIVQEADRVTVGREWFFYILLLSIVGVNLLVYLLKMVYAGEALRSWFHGIIITINIFIIVALHALNVYNSSEIFDHSRVIYIVIGSLGLILLWAIAWPLYLLFQKFFVKQAV